MKTTLGWICIISCTVGVAACMADHRGLAITALVLCITTGIGGLRARF